MDVTPLKELVAGRRVTVMGLGLLGRAVGDAAFLAQLGALVTVTDLKDEIQLAESVARLKVQPNVTFHLGGHIESDFTDTDMVIKAAGIPLASREIAAARAADVPVYMSTALFAKYASAGGARIVGVTGTRGKSTVTHMIHHVLESCGRRTHLGGNVRGVSTLAMLPGVEAGDTVVLELDSWQLQGFGDLGISPHIAIFTNLLNDHQNYYPDEASYFSDKSQIYLNQKAGEVLIAGEMISARIRETKPVVEPRVPPALSPELQLRIPGEHNRENAALAAEALRALGIPDESISEGLTSFAGVEGRLQFVTEHEGVKIFNDNNATTPEAALAALRSFEAGKIILIAGGSDKGLDLTTLAEEIRKRCKAIFLIGGTGTEKLLALIPDTPVSGSLEEAVAAARSAASDGDIILFSPAFASFGMFRNEYDRNDRFLALTKSL